MGLPKQDRSRWPKSSPSNKIIFGRLSSVWAIAKPPFAINTTANKIVHPNFFNINVIFLEVGQSVE